MNKNILLWIMILIVSINVVLAALPLDELFYPVSGEEKELCSRKLTTSFETDDENYNRESYFTVFMQTSVTLQATKKKTAEDYLYEVSWFVRMVDDIDGAVEIEIEQYNGEVWKDYASKELSSNEEWVDYKAEYTDANITKMKIKLGKYEYVTNVVEID